MPVYAYRDDIVLVGPNATIKAGAAGAQAKLQHKGLEARADKRALFALAAAGRQGQGLAETLDVPQSLPAWRSASRAGPSAYRSGAE